jgi:branched-chain amino acid aminotransferase
VARECIGSLDMCAYVQANTNGRLHDATEPSIPPLNRGFLYGDAIYEVWRTYDGVIFAWDEHWERLYRSAESLFLQVPFSPVEMLVEIRKTMAAYRERVPAAGELYVRLQITRGAGIIGLDIALADQTAYVLLVQENKLLPADKFAAGLELSIANTLRRNAPEALNPAWKTGNYLNNILCLREARVRGADEVIICNQKGEITEAAVSNVAFVRKGELITPPLGAGILAGITRKLLLEEIAPALGMRVHEEVILPSDLSGMDECMLLSTTKDVSPVRRIDDYTFKVGPGTASLALKDAFQAYVRKYIARRPELRVFD